MAEYPKDFNATQAAIRAGYSPKTANREGARLLSNAVIVEAMAAAREERIERTEITVDYILANTQEVLERCLQRAPVMVRRGRDMVQLEDDEGRDVWQFDARGAMGALSLLSKHTGGFSEKHEHSGPKGAPIAVTVTRVVHHVKK